LGDSPLATRATIAYCEREAMKWFKRGLWLAAWGVWLWLGVGLYRELPRKVGPALCTLPVTRTSILGCVGDSNCFAVRRYPDRDESTQIQHVEVYDAASGQLLQSTPIGPGFNPEVPDRLSIRWGVLLRGERVLADETIKKGGFHALDLLTGKWRELASDEVIAFATHPSKPWVAFTQWKTSSTPSRAVVLNLQTGEKAFERALSVAGGNTVALVFIPDRDALALRVGNSKKLEIEVLPISLSSSGESVGADMPLMDDLSASRNGRICLYQSFGWTDASGPPGGDVFDLLEKRFLSSIPATERNVAPDSSRSAFRPVISPNGQAMLRGVPGALHRVGDGAIIWSPGSHERITGMYGMANRPLPWDNEFSVAEDWHSFWKKWFPKLAFTTLARRSLDTGELLMRTPSDFFADAQHCNASGTLFVNFDGSVHRLPLGINWPLLALCQAILAAPLVLLWALLRWRRRRKGPRHSGESGK
jgi:hypothetical protein